MNNKSKFKTLIIIDLETTGLIYDQPKITELAMIAVNIETLEEMKAEEELPRVLNKFVKFFDPIKLLRAEVAELTGLTNRMLIDYAPFNRETVIAMEAFLSDFQKPMCFVAHNGNLFDFPILFNEIQSALSDPVSCMDSNNHSTTITPSDNSSLTPSPTKDASVQTITSCADHNQTLLLSINCADSLVFFRQMYHLLNDKDIIQHSNENISKQLLITSTEDGCVNNTSDDATIEINSTPFTSAINNHSSPRLGYVDIPIKYIPSPDPARQQPSMKLSQIYAREFSDKTSHLKSHRAEDDCLMLLAILKRYLPDWLEWIEENHHSLNHFSSLPLTMSTRKASPTINVNIKRPLKF